MLVRGSYRHFCVRPRPRCGAKAPLMIRSMAANTERSYKQVNKQRKSFEKAEMFSLSVS